MAKEKYYGTLVYIRPCDEFVEKYAIANHHNQYRAVCKAKSMAEANRIAEGLGLSPKTFVRDYASETWNQTEIEAADKYGFAICTEKNFTGLYVDIREALKKKSS
ncbi:MAG: hypothetical protein GXY05_04055 [Clostridiales bacterium]|nr:hypothetical protein [Clostridiales bacterium]